MKKAFIILTIFLLFTLNGCTQGSGDRESDANSKKNISAVSDFEYTEDEEGNIMITGYIGTAPNIVIPAKIDGSAVTRIGSCAFQYHQAIISVEIPDSVTSIGRLAFSDCLFLSSVSLPQGVKSIDNSAFENCSNLSELTLPDTLTALGDSAFQNCASLKYIKIPKSLIDWGTKVFFNSAIETVDFEEGIEKIGNAAFAYTDIRRVILPKSVRKISSQAFVGCINLESVTLNEGLITIEDSAFGLKSKLTEIVIPASVTELNELTFTRCDTLQSVKFEGNAPDHYQYEGPKYIEDISYTVYYHEGAIGFTSPEWCGYPTEIW